MREDYPRFVTCPCQLCNGKIEFDASDFKQGETRSAECPHCHLETVIFVPHEEPPPQEAARYRPPLLAPAINTPAVLLTIGDIAITQNQIFTPNGIGALAGSQWICSDMSRTESKIPAFAIVLAIIFALLCLLGLLFLLIKETKTTGYVEVSVHTGGVYHKVQIPASTPYRVDEIRDLVNKAQGLAMRAGQ